MTDSLSKKSTKEFAESSALSESVHNLIEKVNENFVPQDTLLPQISHEEQRRNIIVSTAVTALDNQFKKEGTIGAGVSCDRGRIDVLWGRDVESKNFKKHYNIPSTGSMENILIASFNKIVRAYALNANELAKNIYESDIVTGPGHIYKEDTEEMSEEETEEVNEEIIQDVNEGNLEL